MMTYEQWEEMVIDYLDNTLSEKDRKEFEHMLKANPQWQKDLQDASAMQEKLHLLHDSEVPEKIAHKLRQMAVSGKREKEKKSRDADSLKTNRLFKYAWAAGLILFGFLLGKLGDSGNSQPASGQISALQNEVQEMRQMVSLSMLKQQSPSARLQGIRFTAKVEKPDDELVIAIIRLLKTDPNVNVRLASVEALYLFRNYSIVKKQLIDALKSENSPLVQVAIIDLLVDIKEYRAIEALKQILNNKEINEAVRQRAEVGIKKLS